jgi:two-component system, LytTR family, response regulator
MNKKEIKAIIVEDMASYIEAIEILLEEVAPDVRVIGKATSLESAEKLIISLQPDLVLLDIQFEREGQTGYDLLEKLENMKLLNFHIIIITGHTESEYYERAFDFHVIHFLRKPLNKLRLADALNRVRSNLNDRKFQVLTDLFEKEFRAFRSSSNSRKINITGLRYNEVVDTREIAWIEASGRHAVFYLKGGKTLLSMRSLGDAEGQVAGLEQFIRIHRSEIINLDFVERYSVKERLILLSEPGPNHYASRERFPDFLQRMGKV